MKTRGTRGGILLTLDASDDPEALHRTLLQNRDVLAGTVYLELTERIPWPVVRSAVAAVEEAGGNVAEVRPPAGAGPKRRETVIVARTVRSGGRVESHGSILVLGDVNAGAELVAEDDIIVVGMLRGLAHAGAGGNENAIIWAQAILSPQLRIGGALAQAGEEGRDVKGPEVAHLANGQIVLRPWER